MPASEPPTREASTPFAGLDPNLVLEALDDVGLRGDGRLLQLNSYENRVFQVFLEDGRVVVTKFYRPGRWSDAQILEEHRFAAELAEAEIPVAAPCRLDRPTGSRANSGSGTLIAPTLALTDASRGGYRFSVSERISGRAPELDDPDTLEWIGRFIGRIHAVGARSRFQHRLTMDEATFGRASRDWLIATDLIPPDALPQWLEVTDLALTAVRHAFAQDGTSRTLRLHGDCHLGNMLWNETGPHFVDLDDAVSGPATQDLWMLLSGDRASMTRQLAAVLEGYESFMDFDWRELRLIEPLRTLRIIHHSAWLARRWNDPAFPVAFPWFEGTSYWADQTVRLREQLVAMAEPPLGSHRR